MPRGGDIPRCGDAAWALGAALVEDQPAPHLRRSECRVATHDGDSSGRSEAISHSMWIASVREAWPMASGAARTRPPEREPVNERTVRPLDAYGALAYLLTRNDVSHRWIAVQGWSNGGSTVLNVVGRRSVFGDGITTDKGFQAGLAFYPGCGPHALYQTPYTAYGKMIVLCSRAMTRRYRRKLARRGWRKRRPLAGISRLFGTTVQCMISIIRAVPNSPCQRIGRQPRTQRYGRSASSIPSSEITEMPERA